MSHVTITSSLTHLTQIQRLMPLSDVAEAHTRIPASIARPGRNSADVPAAGVHKRFSRSPRSAFGNAGTWRSGDFHHRY